MCVCLLGEMRRSERSVIRRGASSRQPTELAAASGNLLQAKDLAACHMPANVGGCALVCVSVCIA